MNRPDETQFDIDNYDAFYEHHHFQPLADHDAIDAQRIIPRVAWAVDVAKELKPKNILDLGCLDGSLILTLLNNLPTGAKGTGIDLSQEGVDIATERASLHGLPAEFVRQDIESWMEQAADKYDLVTCFEVMEHVKDPELVIKLIDKVLAPGGTVLISTPDFEAPTYGKDDERNKCHIRLYTLADDDYEATNKFGTLRKATSLSKQLHLYDIKEMETFSELINCRYERHE